MRPKLALSFVCASVLAFSGTSMADSPSRIIVAAADAGATAAPADATASGVVLTDAKGVSYTGDPVAGAKIFNQCATCHSVKAGENKIGPSLHGVIGRTAGTAPGYTYSKANKESGITWDMQTIFDYLENPRAKVPGTKMAFIGLKKPQDRANVIAYLKQVADADTH